MSNARFDTGKAHQIAVAKWARQRLADRGGQRFFEEKAGDPADQVGCLLADGVGLGKTWEALAAIALLLDKREWRNRRRRAKRAVRQGRRKRRINHRRHTAHVLVLLPPGLVAKWWRELHNPERDAFPHRLAKWARQGSREFVAATLSPASCYVIRKRTDLKKLPRGRKKRGRYVLPPGTYLCNWNVLRGEGGHGLDRVNALKNQRWEVVVVDEAHHRRARAALDSLKHAAYTLLLTATPFQLDMTELHGLTRTLLDRHAPHHKVLKRGAVSAFAKAADRAFDGGDPPTPADKRAAEEVLRQLVACSDVGRQRRRYFTINRAGEARPITAPSELEETGLVKVFEQGIDATDEFDEWYLRQRLRLAGHEAGERPRHIAVELRKLLSVNKAPSPPSPRLEALGRWACRQFVTDLTATLEDGVPRKLLVFTHLKTNVASEIKRVLVEALDAACQEVRRLPAWRAMRKKATAGVEKAIAAVTARARSDRLRARLEQLARKLEGTLYFDLFGNERFARLATRDLIDVIEGEDRLLTREGDLELDRTEWHKAQRRTKERTARALFAAVSRSPLAATFTGDDTRLQRDAMAEAFKTALAPWILVATNVGSEGIDLHTYSAHLVHFDLEWNPARMEQREGRIDRLGRQLKQPACIYYLLVKDTYDERMFHQLIARQRWHTVLLGRKALQLGKADGPEAALLSTRQVKSMSLNLDPRWR